MDDSAAAQPQGHVLPLARPSDLAGDTEEEEPVLVESADSGDVQPCRGEMESEEEESGESDDDGEDDDSYYEVDKDGEEDGSDHEADSDDDVDVPLKIDRVVAAGASGVRDGPPLLRRLYVPEGQFLGPAPRFASAGNTAGFLGVAVVVAPPDRPAASSKEQGGGKEILVLYRYTEFEPAPDGLELEVSKKTKLHYLRFAVPPAGNAAGSLQWAGSSLAPLIYPLVQALWSRLVSNVGIPPGTMRLKLIADVGILRLEYHTRGRMDQVSAALQGMIAKPWPGYHVAMDLRLPEPVHVQCADEAETADGEGVDCERPAKRRKVAAEEVAGQECPVCFELLENDLAVWPGCSLPHVFHGACLKLTLTGSEMCPLCRRRLSVRT